MFFAFLPRVSTRSTGMAWHVALWAALALASSACSSNEPECSAATDCAADFVCNDGNCVSDPALGDAEGSADVVESDAFDDADTDVAEDTIEPPPDDERIPDVEIRDTTPELDTTLEVIPDDDVEPELSDEDVIEPADVDTSLPEVDDGSCEVPEDCDGDQLCDVATSTCVDCLAATDCRDGQSCDGGRCTGRPTGVACVRLDECGAGMVCDHRIGECAECLTRGDCDSDERCVYGVCETCDCPAGQGCALDGTCQRIATDPSSCANAAQCQAIYLDLGGNPLQIDTVACDPVIGCFLLGSCTGSIFLDDAGTLPTTDPSRETVFGPQYLLEGPDDPFGAGCGSGRACTTQLESGVFLSSTASFRFVCACDVDDDSACRDGEACVGGLLPPPLGAAPVCR